MANDSSGPFASDDHLNFATWFVQGKVAKSPMDGYFPSGWDDTNCLCLQSNYTFRKHKEVLDQFGEYMVEAEVNICDSRLATTFNYQNIIDYVRVRTPQVEYSSSIAYTGTPIRESGSYAELLYSEMHTVYWWCDRQV